MSNVIHQTPRPNRSRPRRVRRLVVAAATISASFVAAPAAHASDPPPPPVFHGVTAAAADASPDPNFIYYPLQLDVTATNPPATTLVTQNFRLSKGSWVAATGIGTTNIPNGTVRRTYTEGVSIDGKYLVRVASRNAFGDSAPVFLTVDVPSVQVTPGALASASVTPGLAPTVTWSASTDLVYGYELLRARNDTGVWTNWTPALADFNETSFTDTVLPDGFYVYLVRPYNNAGAGPWTVAGTTTVNRATTPPPTPNLQPLTTAGASVSASWNDVNTETRYTMQRARYLPNTATWSEWTFTLHDRNATSAQFNAVPDGIYAYVLTADNAVGSSAPSIRQVTVSSAIAIPDAPTSVTATRSSGGVNVTWADNASGADGEIYFDVQRAQLVGGVYTNWTSWVADRDATTFTDPSVAAGQYAYLVRAVNPLGASAWTTVEITVT